MAQEERHRLGNEMRGLRQGGGGRTIGRKFVEDGQGARRNLQAFAAGRGRAGFADGCGAAAGRRHAAGALDASRLLGHAAGVFTGGDGRSGGGARENAVTKDQQEAEEHGDGVFHDIRWIGGKPIGDYFFALA